MSISITAKTDYSLLFSSMNQNVSSSTSTITSLLSDYSLIKSGAYSKLMKAYYSAGDEYKSGLEDLVNSSTTTTTDEQLYTVKSESESLKESADNLLSMDFSQMTEDEIYSEISAFVDSYNSTLSAVSSSSSSTVQSQASSLISTVSSFSSALKNLGIEFDSNQQLSIDEETLKSADVSTLTSTFNGMVSFAYRVSSQASIINYTASNAITQSSSYSSTGSYSNLFSTGTSYEAFF